MNPCRLSRWSRLAAPLALVLVLFAGFIQAAGAQSNPDRVGLVVQYSDGTIFQKCVEVSQPEVSGYEVLLNSGLAIIADFNAWLGAGICKIESQGCEADDCFCDMPNYWSYWHLDPQAEGGPAWRYSNLGASNYTVQAGQVEGWHYGQMAPPAVKPSFAEICSEPTATSADSEPTSTPTAPPATARAFIPTSPPRWATAVIIGPTLPASPQTALLTQTQPPPTATIAFPDAPSATAGQLQPEVESQVEATLPAETPVPETSTPSATPPAPEQPARPLISPTSSDQAHLAMVGAQPASPETSIQPAPIEQELAQPAEPVASKLALLLGGLAGFGAFAGFVLVLLGVLFVIILVRKQ